MLDRGSKKLLVAIVIGSLIIGFIVGWELRPELCGHTRPVHSEKDGR